MLKTQVNIHALFKITVVADMIPCAQAEKKIKTMKKSIMILMMVATGFFCSGQSSTDSVYTGTSDSVKAEVVIDRKTKGLTKAGLAKAIETGTIYNSTSPYHNDLHEFTYLVAMRDFCNKTLLQMRVNGEENKKLSKKLERELSKAKAELASAKFNGLKIESGQYEVFLKQINDRFKD
jgi:hypothetical protein